MRYRFRLPTGEVYEGESKAAIRRAHPQAVITHKIVMDELGQGAAVPYLDELEAQPEDVTESADAAPATPEPGEDAPRKGRKDR